MSEPVTVPEPSAEEMDQAVEAAARVMREKAGKSWDILSEQFKDTFRDHARVILTAAVPLLTAGVVAAAVKAEQERIATAIEAEASDSSYRDMPQVTDTYLYAARIARGETP